MRLLLRFAFSFCLLFLCAFEAQAATFTVNSVADNESNGCSIGVCTLREAINAANSNGTDDTIVFDSNVFGTPQTITLNGTALPDIINEHRRLSIVGTGTERLVISGNNLSGFIRNFSSGGVTISDLTIQATRESSGAIDNNGRLTLNKVNFKSNSGGPGGISAIFNDDDNANLTMNNCLVSDNTGFNRVIYNTGTVTITASRFESNQQFSNNGGGNVIENTGTLTLTRTTISNNRARAVENSRTTNGETGSLTVTESAFFDNDASSDANGGGAIVNLGTGSITISSSSLYNNNALQGGGISSFGGTVSLINTTVFLNQAKDVNSNYFDSQGGGGLWLKDTTATLINCTIYKNDSLADTGGVKKIGSATVNVFNTIIAGNTARTVSYFGAPFLIPDAFGSFTTSGGNIIGNTTLNGGWSGSSGFGDKTDVSTAAIGLATSLANNGGYAPSVAINCCGLAFGNGKQAANNLIAPTADQRRIPRVNNNGTSRNDAGAYQFAEQLAAPGAPDLLADSDSGVSNADNITNSRAPVIKITNAIPNATLYIFKNGNGFLNASADGNGEHSFADATAPADGTINYTVKQEIPGTGSGESAILSVVYDTLAPTASLSAAGGQANPATTQPVNIIASFSEPSYNFDLSDVSFANSTADLGNANFSVSGAGISYAITISNIGTIGRILPALAAGAATDAAGNPNSAANLLEIKYIGDRAVSVTKTADGANCLAADCSLRGALALVNDLNLPATNFTVNFSNLPSNDAGCAAGICTVGNGELVLQSNVTITGAGAPNRIAVSGANQRRVFYNAAGANATLKNLIVTGGNATSQIFPAENGDGGGIVNRGTLRLENVSVLNNSAALYNGAIGNHGFLTIINSTVSNNVANDSQFGTTGGIGSDYDMLIVNSTISGNRAPNANTGAAGGIWSSGLLYIINSTITDNEARTYGGVNSAGNFQTFVRNSIIAGNRGLNNAVVPDIGSTVNPARVASLGNNLIGNRGTNQYFTQPTDQTGGAGNPVLDAKLTPLGNYGGLTQTHAILNNSPAKNAGNNCVTTNNCANGSNIGFNLTTDQRGSLVPRKIGMNIDIGAFEANLSFSTSETGTGGEGTLPSARTNENYSVTFTASRQNNFIESTEDSGDYNDESAIAPFTYSVAAGNLPPGLSLNSTTGVLSGMTTQTGTFNFTLLAADADGIAGAQSYALSVLAPTAATVSVGGKVLTASGRGIFGAIVAMTDSSGNVRYARTNSRGIYRFHDVAAGETYIFNAGFKRYSFAPPTHIRSIVEETDDINFIAEIGGVIR